MDSPTTGLKRFIFWDYPRASWQYDIMVGLILLFIFLTPSRWFHDQPHGNSVAMIQAPEHGLSVFWIDPQQFKGVPDQEREATAGALLRARTGKKQKLVKLEPIFDSEDEIRGYMAFTQP